MQAAWFQCGTSSSKACSVQGGNAAQSVFLQCNLRSEVGFLQAAGSDEQIGYMNITCTKTLGNMTGHQAAHAKAKVQLEAADCVTAYLFKAWVSEHSHLVGSENHFFFPYQGTASFDFSKPISAPQHDKAVQRCASVLKLPTTVEHLKSFTSQSVRVGVGSQVAKVIREQLLESNQQHGRAPGSMQDAGTYVPDQVLMAPGPLFGDMQGIKQRMQAAEELHFGSLKQSLLCTYCGYPACKCPKCNSMKAVDAGVPGPARTSAKHDCWLAGRTGPKKKSGPQESDEAYADRVAAWIHYGIEVVPEWRDGKYSF